MGSLDFSAAYFLVRIEMEKDTSSAGRCFRWRTFKESVVQIPFSVTVAAFCVGGDFNDFHLLLYSKSKRSVYLLPIYPFMGMLLAEYLLALVKRGAKVFRISAWIFVALALLLTVTFFAVRLDMIPESIWGTGKHAAENIAFVNALHKVQLSLPKWLIVFLPLVAAGCLLYMLVKRADTRSLLYGTAGCILCIFVSLDGVYQPTILAVKSDRHLAVRLNELEPEGMVYSYADWVKFYGINYYLGDRVRIFDKLNPAQGYVLVTDELQEQFLQDTEDTYRVEEVYRTPLRSCDLRRKVIVYKFSKK